MHVIGVSVFALILAVAIAERAGAFGYRGDDYANFDRQTLLAAKVIDGDSFLIPRLGYAETVHLLGVDAPTSHWSAEAKSYLEARLKGRMVTLKLDGTQTRDSQGRLLAYVYITDGDCLNVDIVRDAQAFADRRIKHTLRGSIELVENEARKKKRGMWKDLTDDQQPAWRIDWLRSLRHKKAPVN
jgi:endonuclease YncB( thermonuclease family)